MSKSSNNRRADVAAVQVSPAQQVLAKITGAKLCYGKPINVGAHTVVAVASVRTIGGFGFGKAGSDSESEGSGGGGGGTVDARPVGFIEIGPDGARFHAIDDRRMPLAAIGGGAVAALLLGRLLTRRRRSRVLAPPRARRLFRRALPAGLS
jgi:uncharacterized spore protein YtfJ